MTTTETLTIVALVGGPVLAVWVGIWREAYNRRVNLLRTLVVTRGAGTSAEHTGALNSITLEFYKRKRVQEAWKLYFDHLCLSPQPPDWSTVQQDLFIKLLKEMASTLHMNFDESDLRRLDYRPVGQGQWAADQAASLSGWAKIMRGERPMWVSNERPAPDAPAPRSGAVPPIGR